MIWPLATMEVLPFDFTPVAQQMRETIQGYSRVAKAAFDLSPILEQIGTFENAAQSLREETDTAEKGEPEEMNATLMAISRAINPVLYTSHGPYGHDPALQSPLFPGLEGAERLSGVRPGSGEGGFLKSKLLRELNRIRQALDRAVKLAGRK